MHRAFSGVTSLYRLAVVGIALTGLLGCTHPTGAHGWQVVKGNGVTGLMPAGWTEDPVEIVTSPYYHPGQPVKALELDNRKHHALLYVTAARPTKQLPNTEAWAEDSEKNPGSDSRVILKKRIVSFGNGAAWCLTTQSKGGLQSAEYFFEQDGFIWHVIAACPAKYRSMDQQVEQMAQRVRVVGKPKEGISREDLDRQL